MAHVYVVTSATFVGPANTDPPVTIIGNVDGEPVTVQVWLSAVQQANTAGGITAVKNLVAPVMLAQATAQISARQPAVVTQLPTGTFTQ